MVDTYHLCTCRTKRTLHH